MLRNGSKLTKNWPKSSKTQQKLTKMDHCRPIMTKTDHKIDLFLLVVRLYDLLGKWPLGLDTLKPAHFLPRAVVQLVLCGHLAVLVLCSLCSHSCSRSQVAPGDRMSWTQMPNLRKCFVFLLETASTQTVKAFLHRLACTNWWTFPVLQDQYRTI